jgi:hypothetical protein
LNEEAAMERMIERRVGLDVDQARVVMCGLSSERGKRPRNELRTVLEEHFEVISLLRA